MFPTQVKDPRPRVCVAVKRRTSVSGSHDRVGSATLDSDSGFREGFQILDRPNHIQIK